MDPNFIIIISGKRKSGKDYISNKLSEMLRKKFEKINIGFITLAAVLKETFAIENNLDYKRLLDSSDYKEKHRKELIKLE
jgi:phosphomevalonate kinase